MVFIKNEFLFVFLFLFYSCSQKKRFDFEFVENKVEDSMKFNNWKIDSWGCLNLRSLDLAKELIENNLLINDSIQRFINIFGAPNEINEEKNLMALIYYSETQCINGEINTGADKCWVQFNFSNQLLIEVPSVFACE